MKRILTAIAIAAALALSATAHAGTSIRVDGGKEVIQPGDPASKAARYLGRPYHRAVAKVCKAPSRSSCGTGSKSAWGNILSYDVDGNNYSIQVYGSTITYIEWSR